MASDIVMPRLSDSMEEGTVLKWLVSEGDEVSRGDPLVEIETDKANMTYEADSDGVLVEIVASEGTTLPIGEVIARIGAPGESGGNGGAPAKRGGEEQDERAAEDADGETAGGERAGGEERAAGEERAGADERASGERAGGQERPAAGQERPAGGEERAAGGEERPRGEGRGDGDGRADGDGRVKASPVARRMARELGVELASVEGSGPGGRVVKADVEAAAKRAPEERAKPEPERAEPERAEPERAEPGRAEPAAPEPVAAGEAGAKGELHVQDLTRLQQTVSRRMAESKATAPDFALYVDVDMTRCIELRRRLKEVADPAPSYNDMVVKAVANALREHPRVNAAYRDGRFELYSRVNVGVAVAARDALVVPTIFDADRKSLGQIARDARAAIERVRDGQITPPELAGGTFTVSNLGMYGIDAFTAIINPPQAGLLTVGALKKRPAVDESGRVVARDQATLGLICDHRILYGADGAQFLARVRELLEQPLALAL